MNFNVIELDANTGRGAHWYVCVRFLSTHEVCTVTISHELSNFH